MGWNLSAPLGGAGAGGQPRFPGAWPSGGAEDRDVMDRHVEDEHNGGGQEAGISMRDDEGGDGGAHAVSGAMYASLEERKREPQGRRDALASFRGDACGEDGDGEKEGASTLVVMLAQVEELERVVDRLTLEADEQFARELADLEG